MWHLFVCPAGRSGANLEARVTLPKGTVALKVGKAPWAKASKRADVPCSEEKAHGLQFELKLKAQVGQEQ